jgi:GDP-4-dehydro-6-deoxy-D-mannose reductase
MDETRPVVLITGASGFVGRWLAAAYLGAEARRGGPPAGAWRVVGTSQLPVDTAQLDRTLTSARDDLAPVTLSDVEWQVADLRAPGAVEQLIATVRPTVIIHLAAMSFVPQATSEPALAVDVNVTLTVRLLHAASGLRAAGLADPTVLIVGSAEQYGRQGPDAHPLSESAEQLPLTVYGATKAAGELFARQFGRSTGLRVLMARPFNHTGPGQEPRFLLPALVARAIALRTAPPGAPFAIGNVDTIRDMLHVRDVVAAYIAMLARGAPGEAYNVASGTGRTTGELAAQVLARAHVQAVVTQDPALVRPAEVPVLVGDASKLRAATGWVARFSLDDLLDDLLDAAAR